jgi:hypothetical protein
MGKLAKVGPKGMVSPMQYVGSGLAYACMLTRTGNPDYINCACFMIQIPCSLQAIRATPLLLAAWSTVLREPSPSDDWFIDQIAQAALELLPCFDNHSLGRLLVAVGLAGGAASSGDGPRHGLLAAASAALPLPPVQPQSQGLREYPVWLLCAEPHWQPAAGPVPSSVLLDVLCAHAMSEHRGDLDWACRAAAQLADRWERLAELLQSEATMSSAPASDPLAVGGSHPRSGARSGPPIKEAGAPSSAASLISWMDSGSLSLQAACKDLDSAQLEWEVEVRGLVDGLWALSRLLGPAWASATAADQGSYGNALTAEAGVATADVVEAVERLLPQLLMHGLANVGDAAKVLSHLVDIGHPASAELTSFAASFLEHELLAL